MFKKHQTPKYIYFRLKQILFEKRNPHYPWMTSQSIKLLDQLIVSSDIGLEFGSGRSTFWFAQRCKHLTSIEHNEKWFHIVSKKILSLSELNVEYSLQELNDNPLNSQYYNSINKYLNSSLDFIIVDGVYRDIIAIQAVDKLKVGGVLILDNAERYLPNNFNIPESIGGNIENVSNTWKEFIAKVKGWRQIWTSNGVTATLLLIKTLK